MTDSRRQFPSGAKGSAWGQTHLALDAVVAFVDDELSPGARRRAMAHLAGCIDCAAEIVSQTQARMALRTGPNPAASSSLLSSLRAIPSQTELPAAPAGLAVAADGELVALGPHPHSPQPDPHSPQPAGRRRGGLDRRLRVGGAAAVSGLALGALMLTGTGGSAPPGPVQTAPGAVVDARLQFGGAGVRNDADNARLRTPQVPGTRKLAHQRWYR